MIKPEAALEALSTWCDERGIQQGVEEFTKLLRRRNITYILPALFAQLEYRAKQLRKKEELRLTTAEKTSSEQMQKLRKSFDQDDEAHVSEEIDPGLIAGMLAEQDGVQIEASIRGRLQELKNHLHT